MKVLLTLPNGAFVYRITLPPFLILPEVIVWGTRTFIHAPDAPTDSARTVVYREGFAWWEPTEPEGTG